MTQQEVIKAAKAQLPNPAEYEPETYQVDFNQTAPGELTTVGTDPIDNWEAIKNQPLRVSFIKEKTRGLSWEIIDPLEGFSLDDTF